MNYAQYEAVCMEIGISGISRIAGQDIVCAAVSALVQTLIRSVQDLGSDKIEYDISSGRADIRWGDLSEKSKTLVDSFFIGICMIADEYPDNVRIV